MGRKTVIEQSINKHTKELEISIRSIEPKLIEAFVKVYGEKHREKITNTILNMNYIFFISEQFCHMFTRVSKGIRKRYKYIMQSYIKYLNKQNYRFNTVGIKDEEKFIVKNILCRYPFKIEDYSTFADSLECDYPCCSAALYEYSENIINEFYICLPIFTIDLKTIIHEINHALNFNVIGFTDEALIMQTLFKTESCEELVNDFIAELVKNVYIEIGGIIPKDLQRINIGNEYVYKDYIVNYLFKRLINLILESRISGNFNLFYELVGKDKTEQLERIIDDLYKKDYFDKYLYTELINLVDEIYEKVINSEIISPEEILKNLENQGLKLRRIKKKEEEK